VEISTRVKWASLPIWARWVLAVYMIGFVEGFADHVRWMTRGGIHAYAHDYPLVPIQVFFVSLIVVEPLTIVLLGFVRREGIWLACAVMVLDMAANWIGNWSHVRDDWALNVPWLITVFGLFVLSFSLPMLRLVSMRRTPLSQRQAACPGGSTTASTAPPSS
jgi:hypothetical protein